MKTLVVIPHAFLPNLPGHRLYGSERNDAPARSAALLRCISAMRQTFGPRQHMVDLGFDPHCNTGRDTRIDIVVCTRQTEHLVHTVPPHLVYHHKVDVPPRALGFAAQALMRDHAREYDWFVYLEDDCEVTDPLFFTKLAWFDAEFGEDVLLQPNRFEISHGPIVQKLYIDGRLGAQRAQGPDNGEHPWLQAASLGRTWWFRRVGNPHAGCFFVNAGQMARLAADPAFGHYADAFIGPLESAATLSLFSNFAVYKPARVNAGFLEIHHLDQRLLDKVLSFTVGDAGDVVRTVNPDH